MKTQDKQITQEVIHFLLIERMSYLLQHLDKSNESLITEIMREYNTDSFGFEVEEKFFELGLIDEEYHKHIKKIEKHIIGLNSFLRGTEKVKEAVDLEQQMKKIQAKKFIDTNEFAEIYGYSKEWQKRKRGNIHNRLPFQQNKRGGKIIYVVEDVNTWFENNNIR